MTEGPSELLVILTSETAHLIENHMPDGSSWDMDLAYFRELDGISREQAARRGPEVS